MVEKTPESAVDVEFFKELLLELRRDRQGKADDVAQRSNRQFTIEQLHDLFGRHAHRREPFAYPTGKLGTNRFGLVGSGHGGFV